MNTETKKIQTWLHAARKTKGLTGQEVIGLLEVRYKIKISKSSFYRYEDCRTSYKAIPFFLIIVLCDIYERDYVEPFNIIHKQILEK